MQQVKRVVLTANVEQELSFPVEGSSFFVVNVGDGDLYVSLGEHIIEDKSFLIPANSYRDCYINENDLIGCSTDKVYLKSTNANTVEVQMTRW